MSKKTSNRIAVISDIHSNYIAIQAVAKKIKELKCKYTYCLGDTVGYGPQPSESFAWVQKNCKHILKGNHEDCICDPFLEMRLNRLAREGCQFSRKNLSADQIKAIGDLLDIRVLEDDDLTICHGSSVGDRSWEYINSRYGAEEAIKNLPTRLLCIGHTHTPFIYSSRMGLNPNIRPDIKLNLDEKYIINVGSVGQPRDNDCRSCFVTLDYEYVDNKLKKTVLNFHRVFYDISKTEDLMKTFDLPPFLSERLYKGN